MTHRAELILEAIKTNLIGIEYISNRVFRDYENVFDIKETPAISIEFNGEEKLSEQTYSQIDWAVNITLVIYIKAQDVTTKINRIRSGITKALMLDYTQGLSFVIDTEELDTTSPIKSFDSEKETAKFNMEWRVHYRRSRDDPEA